MGFLSKRDGMHKRKEHGEMHAKTTKALRPLRILGALCG